MVKNAPRAKVLAITLAVALIGACIGVALSDSLMNPRAATAESLTNLVALASTASELESPFKAVYAEASQSVVGIKLSSQLQVRDGRIVDNTQFVGSGVAISNDGMVVTNYHVVTAGGNQVAENISVVYNNEEYPAEYVAGDEDADIAVLKVKNLNAPAAKIGNSDELSVGDWALVIGNPIDESFVNTLTVGVISGKNRDMSVLEGKRGSNTPMIQTNAAINNGNSGGGLFNIRGELVGITSMKLSSQGYYGMASIEGMGLAIPINTVSKIADDLIEHGAVLYPRMGVTISDINSPSKEPSADHLPASVWIRNVEEGSPAEAAGLQADDLILKADGKRITTGEELQSILRSHKVGETIELEVYRIPGVRSIKSDQPIPDGETLTMQVEVKVID